MPRKHSKTNFAPQQDPGGAQPCQASGCTEAGLYKAPRSRESLRDYQWFCLDHIREFNEHWDYFGDMNREDIEYYMRDAVTGHRPTWTRESRIHYNAGRLREAIYDFLEGGTGKPKQAPALAPRLRKALAVLDLTHPYTHETLKSRYRALVKQHHPDLHRGDKRKEELFKHINAAYSYLETLLSSGE